MKQPLVSIIIPTKNSALFLENCLKSIKNQSYPKIETLVVDSKSTDKTLSVCKKYKVKVYQYHPKVKVGKFDAPHKRNYGTTKAKGKYVYYLDADMELPRGIIKEAVAMGEMGYDALILSEDSFGNGIWAQAKQLERRCYWGDETVEAARFFKKSVWDELGGLDEALGGGGDDWDLQYRLVQAGFKLGRTKRVVLHNEGELSLIKLIKKRFMYGRDSIKYLVKRPQASFVSYFPIRKAYLKNWRLFAQKPFLTIAFIFMRSAEYAAGFSGILYSFLEKDEK